MIRLILLITVPTSWPTPDIVNLPRLQNLFRWSLLQHNLGRSVLQIHRLPEIEGHRAHRLSHLASEGRRRSSKNPILLWDSWTLLAPLHRRYRPCLISEEVVSVAMAGHQRARYRKGIDERVEVVVAVPRVRRVEHFLVPPSLADLQEQRELVPQLKASSQASQNQ